MLIGITGGIGSGKSMVAEMVGKMLPAPVLSSDEICRHLLERGEAGYQQVIDIWGSRFLIESGEIDRTMLRTAVFDDSVVRATLEGILHPLVRLELLRVKEEGGSAVLHLAEVPLLFESGWQADFDYIICVTADMDIALRRVVERDSVRPTDVEKIMRLQMDPVLKAERSDWVIDNSGSRQETVLQVEKLVDELRRLLALN